MWHNVVCPDCIWFLNLPSFLHIPSFLPPLPPSPCLLFPILLLPPSKWILSSLNNPSWCVYPALLTVIMILHPANTNTVQNIFQLLLIQQQQKRVHLHSVCLCRVIFGRRTSTLQCQFYGRQGMQGRETSAAGVEDPKVRHKCDLVDFCSLMLDCLVFFFHLNFSPPHTVKLE